MATRILVIDDSPMLLQFIVRTLTPHAAGYEVVTAPDGEQGLVLADLRSPEVILLDFGLPGLKGDAVCRELTKSAHTRGMPVVLMSGTADDLERTAAECSNVVKTIAKPFTPELLCATVGGVVRTLADQRGLPPAPLSTAPSNQDVRRTRTPCDLSGHTGSFSLHSVLLGIEQDRATGVLRVFIEAEPILLYFQSGRALLATTRDVGRYLGRDVDLVPKSVLEEQAATGCPVPLVALARGEIERERAVVQCRLGGAQLFAAIWTSPRADFEFESLANLPNWLAGVPPFAGSISEWALESLREVGEESRLAHSWRESTGVPVYTRRGYDRIQQIRVSHEERALASLVDNSRSVADIVAKLGVSFDKAESILFRFVCLEIFEHWPAAIVRQS